MIESLMKEIEYCESRGFHKLADTLTLRLIKYSRDFQSDVQDSNFAGGVLKSFINSINYQKLLSVLSRCPSCNTSGQAFGQEDLKDLMVKFKVNYSNADSFFRSMMDETNTPNATLKALAQEGDECVRCVFRNTNRQPLLDKWDEEKRLMNINSLPEERQVVQMPQA